MDPLTHGTIGATAAIIKNKHRDKIISVAVCGLLAGMFPDLDIIIRDSSDPMFTLAYHRHFTHSLFFVPFGSFFLAWVLHKICFKKLTFAHVYWSCFVGMFCHGLLDSCTNYGTHLFWPFTNARESWNIISIIDPLFTLPLMAGVILSRIMKSKMPAVVLFIYGLCYLGFGYTQKQLVIEEVQKTAASRGHIVQRIAVNPTLGNVFAWRGQYLTADDYIYVDGYHVAPWKDAVHYDGSAAPLFKPSTAFLESIGEKQRADLEYFTFFSNGWIAEYPPTSGVIGDMRFSMLPTKMDPLWGIIFYPENPDRHVDKINTRNRNPGDVQMLFQMIRGEPLSTMP